MGLLPNKSGLIIGSLIGSALGLLFAREAGKTLRGKLTGANTPQKKFEVLFQEYLKVGKGAFGEVENSEAMREIIAGGHEILAQLKKRAEREGGAAVRFAESKTAEIIAEAEKVVGKEFRSQKAKAQKAVKKVTKKIQTKAKKVAIKVKTSTKKPKRK